MALGIRMERMGSGTTWIPDAVELPSRHFMAGDWMVMLHGFLFGQYDWQGGARGADQWGSLNWAMVMADRPLAGGRVQLRFMPSLDPWTVTRCGYPLLLQTGETCGGQRLADRQHPHDFFMEGPCTNARSLRARRCCSTWPRQASPHSDRWPSCIAHPRWTSHRRRWAITGRTRRTSASG